MGRKVKILLVDDDYEDHFIIKSSFSEIGYPDVIDCLDNGLKLIQYLQRMAIEDLPTLIILDMNMPRVNGLETLRMLKADVRYQYIPVIILSTSVNEREMRDCFNVGAVAYFSKPANYQESLLVAQNIYSYAVQVIQPAASPALWG